MAAAGARNDNLYDDNLDDVLSDDALRSEIELVSVLVAAASSSDRPLRQAEVDRLLGVGLKEDGSAAGSDS